jgi:hypothetical protein
MKTLLSLVLFQALIFFSSASAVVEVLEERFMFPSNDEFLGRHQGGLSEHDWVSLCCNNDAFRIWLYSVFGIAFLTLSGVVIWFAK